MRIIKNVSSHPLQHDHRCLINISRYLVPLVLSAINIHFGCGFKLLGFVWMGYFTSSVGNNGLWDQYDCNKGLYVNRNRVHGTITTKTEQSQRETSFLLGKMVQRNFRGKRIITLELYKIITIHLNYNKLFWIDWIEAINWHVKLGNSSITV